VYYGQAVGWIRTPLSTKVRLYPRHIVLDGDPATPRNGTQQPPATFAMYGRCINRDPCLLWPNGWTDQDATWYGDWPRPRLHCGKGHSSPPHFRGLRASLSPFKPRPCLLWLNGWIDKDATSYGGRPGPRRHCVRWRSSSPTERDTAAPHFSAHFALAPPPISATAELSFIK